LANYKSALVLMLTILPSKNCTRLNYFAGYILYPAKSKEKNYQNIMYL